MDKFTNGPTTIDEYISLFPREVGDKLQLFREVIQKEAPDAIEAIKYRMPTFVYKENLVHFAAFKRHIGFYPTASPVEFFKKELSAYNTSKGAIQFPLDQPLPLQLIRQIVQFRLKEVQSKHQK